MNLRKRPTPDDKKPISTKKIRTSRATVDLDSRTSRIEDLPAELWWKIFSYLDGENIFKALTNLNEHIDNLLTDPRFSIHFKFNHRTRPYLSHFNANQIYSLSVDFNNLQETDSTVWLTLPRLTCLSLSNVEDEQLELLSRTISEKIRQLSVKGKSAKFLSRIILNYFPKVQRIKLNSNRSEFVVRNVDCRWNRFSRVQQLTLEGKIKMSKLFRLWAMVPELRSLRLTKGGIHQCDYWIDEDLIGRCHFPARLSSLVLNIFDDDLTFSNLERLIPTTLKRLFVGGSMSDDDLPDYLSSDNWKRLRSRSHCKEFRVRLDLSSYFDPNDFIGLHKTLNKFRHETFFRRVNIRSKQFNVTIKGSIDDEF